MTWEEPRLVGIDSSGRGQKWFCVDGTSPKFICYDGIADYIECWPGGGMHVEICVDGSSAY